MARVQPRFGHNYLKNNRFRLCCWFPFDRYVTCPWDTLRVYLKKLVWQRLRLLQMFFVIG
jgi:hypothetical protein